MARRMIEVELLSTPQLLLPSHRANRAQLKNRGPRPGFFRRDSKRDAPSASEQRFGSRTQPLRRPRLVGRSLVGLLTTRSLPLLPPPQKKRPWPSASKPETIIPRGSSSCSSTSLV